MPHSITSGRTPADAAGVLQRKLFECQFKELDDTGTFRVYAAVFNNVDRQDDVIEPGAFKDLETFVRDGWGALNHVHTDLPVAWIESAAQDDHGLVVTGRFHSTPEAQACRTVIRERMAAGKAVKCSIGYLIDDAVVETRDGKTIRVLKALTVFEFSFVNLPANPEAEVLSAKAFSLESLGLEDAMSAERGVVEALKSALGLSTKGGRKMSSDLIESEQIEEIHSCRPCMIVAWGNESYVAFKITEIF